MVNVVKQKVEFMTPLEGSYILKHIEACARNCYKSEGNTSWDDTSAVNMVTKLIGMDHTAMLEHYSFTVKFLTNVGVYKELTRHRMASYAIESSRYCNYSNDKFNNEINVIKPTNIEEGSALYDLWLKSMVDMENNYMAMMAIGGKPDQVRSVLNHSVAASVVITANLREWRHILALRCAKAAHSDIRELMLMTLKRLKVRIPVIFDDLYEKYKSEIEKLS